MVQNHYLELLLETGVIGLGLFVAAIVGLLYMTRRHKYLWAVIAGFLVQWWFFSGYPNSLHIFLLLAFFYVYSLKSK